MTFKVKDHYYKKAKKEKFLARSIYKLEEIDKKFKILRKGNSVLDLGYYPGSWVQYTSKKIGKSGNIIGLDIKPVNETLAELPGVTLYEQDILELDDLSKIGMDDKFDIVLSDMAPNTSGVKSLDQVRSLALVEMVFEILPKCLKQGGNIVIKVFDGHEAQQFLKKQKGLFEEFHFLKPQSTRSVSKEFFVIGKGYK